MLFRSTRYNIDPAYAPMIAAGRVAEDAVADALRRASDLRPSNKELTKGQLKAWKALSKEFGEDCHALSWPSARDTAQAAVEAMQKEAEEMLKNPSVRAAYDHFLLLCELTKEHR